MTPHDREETIVPVERPAATFEPGRLAPEEAPSRLPLVWIAIGALLVVAAGVFFALPRWVDEREQQAVAATPVAVEPAAPAEPALSPEALAALEDEAEGLLADLLEQQRDLAARSVESWGEQDWLQYDEKSRLGDDAFLADDFQAAVRSYTEALRLGEVLLLRSEQLMESALIAGDSAIAAGNAALAGQQYGIVLAVDPDNNRAAFGQARAEKLPEVLELTQLGNELRQAQSLAEAADAFRSALAIDPEWTPARTALTEVNARLAAARFDNLLSSGFAALAEQEYADAASVFREALAARPGSQAAGEGLEQAEQGQKLDAIALAEIRALAFERRELWDQAIERYQAALEIDATLEFAITGLERVRARADLDRKLENLIENPDLLLTDTVLADARALLDQARPLADTGDRIAAQVSRLGRLVVAASTPITVQLRSDGLTDVSVYRVGSLGGFLMKEVDLRPGTYTAVGSRRGYRDVRATFTVLPGRDPPAVDVVCTEPI